ncbi:MAG: sigma 54-dependent Fis family transcriptional regulator, partial [Candidatus Aminicenantes bacterium]|nr:sigma 54-dependent Fis family transcriptional regulator [Candidatus Aminicenantes bacterium]
MKYLLYYIDGFIKKFPLERSQATIGRTPDNDLTIDDETISRNHLQVRVEEDFIGIKDMDSTNGTYVKRIKVQEAVIKVSESFSLGRIEFFLKKGTYGDFTLAKELIPIFKKITSDNEVIFKKTKTKYISDIYNETLKHIIQTGMRKNDFNDFIPELSNALSTLAYIGDLFLVSRQDEEINLLFSIKKDSGIKENLEEITAGNPDIFERHIEFRPVPAIGGCFYSYPLKINSFDGALIYISADGRKEADPKIKKFLLSLSEELALLSQLYSENKDQPGQKDTVPGPREEIIAGSEKMKELIKQTRKIAASDVFVLIQGESGTGKELFARLIYKHSKRFNGKFVAINCAAIPENLLETELFGHEKGAFTGAISRKEGKLEVASGGILVLDEIGDMTLSLQSKLLRALQEQEFYRLGGSTPIKVDLRIISITNQNLKLQIKRKKFRHDLYYRIVHHTINIPPLRDRKEDISVLINFFTTKFCRQTQKKVRGYSLKAFKALQDYNWPGNVRQLENEINRIVNLTDDGEIINHVILSDEIKYPGMDFEENSEFSPLRLDDESEKDIILKLLEKNNWNKSKTA